MARRSVPGLIFGLIWLALVAATVAPLLLAAASHPAFAQEQQRVRRGGLLELFFGRRQQVAPPEAVKPRVRSRPQRSGGRSARSSRSGSGAEVARESRPPTVEKLENARTVLVVGDFMAGGLAEGLDDAFAESPGIRVVSRANGSSGFVRDDYYDWPGEIGAILQTEKPAAVLVMIGSNDRQQLLVGGNRERVRSEAWMKEYEARARKLADAIRASGTPLLWVGMPAFRVSTMSTDMVALNDVYRRVAEEVRGEFIDIWDGFVDENGAFAAIGPDVNGQRVRLRGSDGINLTKAGKRKVAFYAERPLNRLLGAATAPGIAALDPSGAAPSALGLHPTDIDRTQPISLNDPALDGSTDLLGSDIAAHREKLGMPVEQLVLDGIASEGKPGRADDFASPPVVAAPAAVPAPETTATIAK